MDQSLNITLACMGRESELIVVCGADRIVRQKLPDVELNQRKKTRRTM